jgi:hypothetical protein
MPLKMVAVAEFGPRRRRPERKPIFSRPRRSVRTDGETAGGWSTVGAPRGLGGSENLTRCMMVRQEYGTLDGREAFRLVADFEGREIELEVGAC